MPNFKSFAFATALSAASFAGTLLAAPASPSETAYFVPYAGWFDAINTKQEALQIGAEYRFSPVWQGIRPMVGASITSDSAVYGYGGFAYDFSLAPRWFLTPSVVAGLYHEESGKDLGGPILFRSTLELGYGFDDSSRVSIALNHASNASIYDKNPGAETLLIGYHIPW